MNSFIHSNSVMTSQGLNQIEKEKMFLWFKRALLRISGLFFLSGRWQVGGARRSSCCLFCADRARALLLTLQREPCTFSLKQHEEEEEGFYGSHFLFFNLRKFLEHASLSFNFCEFVLSSQRSGVQRTLFEPGLGLRISAGLQLELYWCLLWFYWFKFFRWASWTDPQLLQTPWVHFRHRAAVTDTLL